MIFYSEVSNSDVMNIEKRLKQTMDMIVIRKKRIAIAKRQAMEKVNDSVNRKSIWGMFTSVGSNRNQESLSFFAVTFD